MFEIIKLYLALIGISAVFATALNIYTHKHGFLSAKEYLYVFLFSVISFVIAVATPLMLGHNLTSILKLDVGLPAFYTFLVISLTSFLFLIIDVAKTLVSKIIKQVRKHKKKQRYRIRNI